jgi:hypothetical protein
VKAFKRRGGQKGRDETKISTANQTTTKSRRFNFRSLGKTSGEKMKSPNDNRFSLSRQERFFPRRQEENASDKELTIKPRR